jgi:hypothetical protein
VGVGNRGLGIGGYEGDDFLGYDFEIVQRSQTLHFEVKATAGEEYEFEMGVSELRAARSARRRGTGSDARFYGGDGPR